MEPWAAEAHPNVLVCLPGRYSSLSAQPHNWGISQGYASVALSAGYFPPMANDGSGYVANRACRCGPPPEECVGDDELLTQHTWVDGEFIDEPRESEKDLSMLRGDVSVEECCTFRSPIYGAAPAKVAASGRRVAAAGKIRAAGLAVVHTPGPKTPKGLHVSIVWPQGNPIQAQKAPWPTRVSEAFKACFNEEEEGREYQ